MEITLQGLTSLLEPVIIVFVGIAVGAIVLAMILPIFRLTSMLL